jgi:hypothetical protein
MVRLLFVKRITKQQACEKKMTLEEDEFIRSFLKHVLPSGFSKITYFGFLALRYLQNNIQKRITLFNKETFLP